MRTGMTRPLETFDSILKEPYPQWTLPDALARIRELAAEKAEWEALARWRGKVMRVLCCACVLIALYGYLMVRWATP